MNAKKKGTKKITKETISKSEKEIKRGQDFCEEALSYLERSSYSQALPYLDRALAILGAQNHISWYAYVLFNKIKALNGLGEHQKALGLCDELQKIYFDKEETRNLALLYFEYSDIHRHLKENNLALKYLLLSKNIALARGYHDLDRVAAGKLADCYLNMNLEFKAQHYLNQALAQVTAKSYEWAWYSKQLADLKCRLLKYQEASVLYSKALDVILANKNYDLASVIMQALIDINRALGDKKAVADWQQKMITIGQSIVVRKRLE